MDEVIRALDDLIQEVRAMTDDTEKIGLDAVGVPTPSLTDWPKAGEVQCEECGEGCVTATLEKGEVVGSFTCAAGHDTPLLASRDAEGEWSFATAPW